MPKNVTFSALWLILLFSSAPCTAAGTISEAISDLYGGDGVTLRNTGLFNHAAHFRGDSLQRLSVFSNSAFDIDLPLLSPDSGTKFEYDPIVDDFVEVGDALGGVFSERAQTLGEGRFNFGFNYNDVSYTSYQGTNLDSINLQLGHLDVGGPGADICIGGPPGACYLFELDRVEVNLDVELNVRALSLYLDYGLTDRWDIGLIVPVLKTSIDVVAEAQVIENETKQFFPNTLHSFDPLGIDGDAAISAISRRHTGLGDIMLRAKYSMLDHDFYQVGMAFSLRIPTGDPDQLQGAGRWGGRASLLLSRRWILESGSIVPHVNLAFDLNNTERGKDEAQIIAGVDYNFHVGNTPLAISADLIRRIDVNQKDGIGDAVSDVAVGIKWKWNNQGSTFVGTRVPLDDEDGLRPNAMIELGGQFSF